MYRWISGFLALVIMLAGGALADVADAIELPRAPLGRVAAGEKHAVVILEDGTCLAFGDNTYGQCGVGEWQNVKAVAAGERHTVALMQNGTCAAVGDNAEGQLDVGEWQNVIAIAAGRYHTVALMQDGACAATGNNAAGQLDVGEWQNVIAIAAGNYLTIGLTSDGQMFMAGAVTEKNYSRDFMLSKSNIHISELNSLPQSVRKIAAGPFNTAVLLFDDGTPDYTGSSSIYAPREWGMCTACYPGIARFSALDSRVMRYWTDIIDIYSYGAEYGEGTNICGVTFGLRADGTVVMANEDNYGQGEVS